MPRAYSPTALRAGAALGLVLGFAVPAAGQTTIFNSGGFESYTLGDITNSGFGFAEAPANLTGGTIQTATVLNGSRAFRASGQAMTAPGLGGANWWYQGGIDYQPLTSGNPYVQFRFAGRFAPDTSGIIPTPTPGAGIFFEGRDSGGTQHAITAVTFGLNGQLQAMTNGMVLSTAEGAFPLNSWHELVVEFDYNNQTFQVYRKGQSDPLVFQVPNLPGVTLTEVPFAWTDSDVVTVEEAGFVVYNFKAGDTAPETLGKGDFFVDDFLLTASSTPLTGAPVPEPGLVLAVGAVGLAGWRVYRRRRVAM